MAKYANIVEQDHRAVKRVTRPMLGVKSFAAAQSTLVGIALMHMRRKGQLEGGVEQGLTVAEQFYALAVYPPHRQGQLPLHDLLSKICDSTVSPSFCNRHLGFDQRVGHFLALSMTSVSSHASFLRC